MYEISLVPDVKGELIRKQKLRNFILLLCVVVAGGCAAVLLVMVSITGGQSIALSGLDEEIDCRYEGQHNGKSDVCKNYAGTAIRKFANLQDILTIQDQMNKVNILNDNKVKITESLRVVFTSLSQPLCEKQQNIFEETLVRKVDDSEFNYNPISSQRLKLASSFCKFCSFNLF